MMVMGGAEAMRFSQPVEIGSIGYAHRSPWNGVFVHGASLNNGRIVKEKNTTSKTPYYDLGIARFGNGDDALYCRYDFPSKMEFGGKDSFILSSDIGMKIIHKVESDSGLTLYILFENWYQSWHTLVIGRNEFGKWATYIDTNKFYGIYFPRPSDYHDTIVRYNKGFYCEGDTLIIPYGSRNNGDGEFRFKWDDSAQWFGIEQVVY